MNLRLLLAVFIVVFGSVFLVSGAAGAEGGYAGFQYGIVNYEEDGFSEDWEPSALLLRGGGKVNKYFGIEGRVGFGISDDTNNVGGLDLTLDIDSLFGVYLLGHVPIAKTSSVYGLLGITRGELTASIAGFGSASDDDTDLSIGIGTEIGLNEKIALNLEYVQYMSESAYDVSAMSFGMVFNF